MSKKRNKRNIGVDYSCALVGFCNCSNFHKLIRVVLLNWNVIGVAFSEGIVCFSNVMNLVG